MPSKKEPSVFIHLQPTYNELRAAWAEQVEHGTIKLLPDFMQTARGWMKYFHPKRGAARAISFCPVVIEVEGHYPVVIYLTGYREQGKVAVAHFAAHAGFMAETTFATAQLALEMLLNCKEINLLEVCIEEANVRGRKMARSLGFKEVIRAGGCVYGYRTSKGEIYGA